MSSAVEKAHNANLSQPAATNVQQKWVSKHHGNNCLLILQQFAHILIQSLLFTWTNLEDY